MNRSTLAFACALALTLAAAPEAQALARPAAAVDRADAGERALAHLRDDASRGIRVVDDGRGGIRSVTSKDGRGFLRTGQRDPRKAAGELLASHGDAFGLDGVRSRGKVGATVPTSVGSVVRVDQVVDGVPVLGGEVVMRIDREGSLLSAQSSTAAATDVPAPRVSQDRARAAATTAVAKAHGSTSGSLRATDEGRFLYDPAVLHVTDVTGARPVWRFTVGNGRELRETVLIGTDRGEVVVRLNANPGLNRVVCDNAGAATVDSDSEVPRCTEATAARTESAPATGQHDVDALHDLLGVTEAAYADLGLSNLTTWAGSTAPSELKALRATVRWCYTDACPLDDAYWDGGQVVVGTGYIADDVIAHEVTHGFLEATVDPFPLNQTTSVVESLADTMGEIVDHRHEVAADDDSAWQIGEDVATGPVRSMEDPTLIGQPDKMTSAAYEVDDFLTGDPDAAYVNAGVGNKTAYLISQGGTFNGRTITGIDAGDPGLTKTGRLYLDAMNGLPSGVQYADLAEELNNTCISLAAHNAASFTFADCAAVQAATAATELTSAPVTDPDFAKQAPISCPTGYQAQTAELQDNDGRDDFDWDFTDGLLWSRPPSWSPMRYTSEGPSSLFAQDPDPSTGQDAESSIYSVPFEVGTEPEYLHFHHAHVFEWYPATDTDPKVYYDGGLVSIYYLDANDDWQEATGLTWVNGPSRTVEGLSEPAFAGDSHGWGSSRVDLSPLAGKTVQVAFTVLGDDTDSFLGWWVDDISVYRCLPGSPGPPTGLRITLGSTTGTMSWQPPTTPASGVGGYVVMTGPANPSQMLPATARSVTFRRDPMGIRVSVLTNGAYGGSSDPVGVQVNAAQGSMRYSTARPRRRRAFTVGAALGLNNRYRAAGVRVTLQRRSPTSAVWTNVASGTTASTGVKLWTMKQTRSTYYRVVMPNTPTAFGVTTAPVLLRTR